MNSFLSVILFPVFLEIAQNITVLDCLKEDLLLGTLIGGILLGSGSGLILRGNGSSGGFDIIGVSNKNRESDVLYLWCGNDFYYFLYGEFDSDKRKQ